jgi:hypothetical protein
LRNIELVIIPNGYVREAAQRCDRIHKTLKALLEAGVIT